MNRVDRLMGYLLLFQSRGLMRAQDFAEQFEISERTVYRDIQSLSEVGVPIVAMPGEGYRLMEGYYLPPITFTPNEARSLYLAISMMAGLTTAGSTQDAAKTALEKIKAVLPPATLQQVEALQTILRFYAFPHTLLDFDDEIFLTLQQAIHDQQVVHLRYHTRHNNKVTDRDIEPLELAYIERAWLLTAYCRLRRDQRVFRLDRIDDIQILKERFSRRDQQLRRFSAEPFTVRVKFDISVARWVRERQHFTFTGEENSNAESVVMLYKPNTFDQLEGWLLGWGNRMEVIEPAVFRERIAEIAAEMMRHHQV